MKMIEITFELSHIFLQRPWFAPKVMWDLELEKIMFDFCQTMGHIPRISLEIGREPQLGDFFDHTKEDLVHWINDKSMDVVKVMLGESVKDGLALIAFFFL